MNARDFVNVALTYVGTKEHPPHSNDGPHIRDWLAGVHQPPGQPWCAAAACGWLAEANGGTCPAWFHPSPGALSLYYSNEPLWLPRGEESQLGDVVVWSHGHGRGHVGVVVSAGEDKLHVVAGNTANGIDYTDASANRETAREGDQVGVNVYPIKDVRIVGYLRGQWL